MALLLSRSASLKAAVSFACKRRLPAAAVVSSIAFSSQRFASSAAAAPANTGAEKDAAAAPSATKEPAVPLAFVSEYALFGEPDKLAAGRKGEDAYFANKYAIGVADGVGGWADSGVDAGEYARLLMKKAAESCAMESCGVGQPVDPVTAMTYAHMQTRLPGSSTACIATTGVDGIVRVANLGDSGMMLWRHSTPTFQGPQRKLTLEEASKLWSVEAQTSELTYSFNFPYQLEFAAHSSKATDSKQYAWRPRVGDIVMGLTDGVYDNLFEKDIQAQLAKFDFAPCRQLVRGRRLRQNQRWVAQEEAEGRTPLQKLKILGAQEEAVSDAELKGREEECRAVLRSMATMIALAAQRTGANRTASTPFSVNGAKAKFRWQGGKPDDVTVLVALVAPDDSRAAPQE